MSEEGSTDEEEYVRYMGVKLKKGEPFYGTEWVQYFIKHALKKTTARTQSKPAVLTGTDQMV